MSLDAMDSYDFIIVGGGASGSLLASRLARSLPHKTFLLVEAGGENAEEAYRTFGERHWALIAPGYNWGYKTVPQQHLRQREIDYSRGKGLGGSTAINFCVYTRGPSADYDHWAELVGDDSWKWESALKRFKKFERFHQPSVDAEKFMHGSEIAHGFHGEVDVGMPTAWDSTFQDFLQSAYQSYPANLDHNSGDPLGVGVCQHSTYNGRRATASEAFLNRRPENLTVLTDCPVLKINFEGKRAVGVETKSKRIHATQEIILSAGAVDSPKLLMLSGVGPAADLQRHGIHTVHDLPSVGKNLKDRLYLELVTTQKDGSHHRTSYINSPNELEEARKQWSVDQTGDLAGYYMPQMIGYLKSEKAMRSQEFLELDDSTKALFRRTTKPAFEILSQIPSPSVKTPENYLATAVAFQATQATGDLHLSSSDPNDPPAINPKFLSHPFDQRLAIESVRETLQFLQSPLFENDQGRLAAGPAGLGDNEILEYIRDTAISMWHVCGTVKMGRPEDETACVDTAFKVRGVEGLRVVDMSVAPLLPSAHTQAVAYLIGETAADKILAQYA